MDRRSFVFVCCGHSFRLNHAVDKSCVYIVLSYFLCSFVFFFFFSPSYTPPFSYIIRRMMECFIVLIYYHCRWWPRTTASPSNWSMFPADAFTGRETGIVLRRIRLPADSTIPSVPTMVSPPSPLPIYTHMILNHCLPSDHLSIWPLHMLCSIRNILSIRVIIGKHFLYIYIHTVYAPELLGDERFWYTKEHGMHM